MKVILHDQSDNGQSLEVEVVEKCGSILINPKGYGDAVSNDESGTPLVIEMWEGDLRVIAWADINQEDYTHIINLSEARVEKRKDTH